MVIRSGFRLNEFATRGKRPPHLSHNRQTHLASVAARTEKDAFLAFSGVRGAWGASAGLFARALLRSHGGPFCRPHQLEDHNDS
jgi:hypothetical protein